TTIIAIAERSKAGPIQQLGAARVLPRDSDLVSALGRESIDVVIDVVGGDGLAQRLEVLVRTGRYAVAGAIAGRAVSLEQRPLYLKDLCLVGCTVPGAEVFPNLSGYTARGELRWVIAATYPLSEIVAALAEFMMKAHVGKIVLTICPEREHSGYDA